MIKKRCAGFVLFFWLLAACAAQSPRPHGGPLHPGGTIVIAQLSDLHLGIDVNPMTKAPTDPAVQLKQAIEMINARGVDAILVSGDISDTAEGWAQARELLQQAKAPVHWLPGNHDVRSGSMQPYRAVFGPDYYRFTVGDVEFIAVDSQLLGNYANFNASAPAPLPAERAAEAEKMFTFLAGLRDAKPAAGAQVRPRARIVVQHVPPFAGNAAPDAKLYWLTHEPWRSREIEWMKRAGVHDILAGHWHKSAMVEEDGFVEHVTPSVGFSAAGVPLGFAIHTIGSDGRVNTEFVELK